jgi:hypothetical protein
VADKRGAAETKIIARISAHQLRLPQHMSRHGR